MPKEMNSIDRLCIDTVRMLSVDMVEKAKSGHPGMPLGASPMAYVQGWRSPVLLRQGDADRDVQFNQTVMLADALRKQKVEVEELVFPDEVHDFLLHKSWLEAYRAAVRFLERHL